jgi:hypothetical protein
MQFMPATAFPALLAYPLLVYATYWTVTSYYELETTISHFGTHTYSWDYFTDTTIRTVKSGVSPTVSPITASTEVYSYKQLTIVYVYLPAGAVAEADIETTATTTFVDSNAYTDYMEPLVYTAPASCPTPFTVTTMVAVHVPSEVTNRLTPTSITTTVLTYSDHFTEVTAYLPPNAVPTTAATTDYVYTYYIANCRNPTATGAAYWGPSGESNSGSSGGVSSSLMVCSLLTGCTSLHTWVIVVAAVFPSLFVLGWVESFLWFRQLMLGRMALRFGTVCWILISLWILCFTRTSPERSTEDQAALKIQWDAMNAGTRWKLWWKWGFRHAYPVELLGFDPRFPNQMQTGVETQRMEQQQGIPVQYVQQPPPAMAVA